MIHLLDIDSVTKNLEKIEEHLIFDKPNEFHTEGLFSEKVFGVIGSSERKTSFSYIDLHAKVIHPTALELILRLDRKINLFISAEKTFSVDSKGALVEDENGVTGISEFIKMFPKINFRTGTEQRDKFSELLKKEHGNGTLFIDKMIIIPPELRPAYMDEGGEWIIDELNNVYQSLMKRAAQVRSSGGSGALFDLMNFSLQKAVVDHNQYIRTRIEKKDGLIRNQMLGKRVDFSGRAVITPGPGLKLHQVGLPMRMAVSLFEPFVIYHLVNSKAIDRDALETEIKIFTGLDLSTDSIQKVFKSIKNGDDVPENLYQIMFDATESAMRGRVVLVKRDPVLHTESYIAYEPILHRGNTILICTLQVGPHNADFDGDQMAVFHPLSDEAQAEARERMIKIQGGSSSTALAFELSMEMWAGLFLLTKPGKSKASAKAVTDIILETITDPLTPVKYRGVTTTAGRAIFNSCFPPRFPFQDIQVNKKITNGLIKKLLDATNEDYKIARDTVGKLEKVAFKWATIMSPSLTIDTFELPKSVYDIKKKIEKADPEEAEKLISEAWKIVEKHIKDTGFGDLVESGAAKGKSQVSQILIAKGIIADPMGNVLEPIAGSYTDGLSNTEYFQASSGARKGIADRVLNTADTGYMSRKLAYVLNSLEADKFLRDCKTKGTLTIKLTSALIGRLAGRYIIGKSGKLEEFLIEDHNPGDVIQLRSPIYCKSPKVCFTCYGNLLKRHKSQYIGILASQVIGERGTQMIMKTFHTGGAVELQKRDMVQDISDGDPLANLNKENINQFFKQQERQLINTSPCVITIDLSNYTQSDSIRIEDTKVWVKSLIASVEFEDKIFSVVLDYPVEILIKQLDKKDKESIKISYPENSIVAEVSAEAAEIKGQIQYVERLLGGREVLKDVAHLYKKLISVYSPPLANFDSVHIECLAAQVLRNKGNIQKPARLVAPYDPILVNIKKVVFASGFIQGIAFENIGEAIRTGLISEDEAEPSIIEKIITGEVIEPTKKRP